MIKALFKFHLCTVQYSDDLMFKWTFLKRPGCIFDAYVLTQFFWKKKLYVDNKV